ncbi:MAG: glycosyltransferase [Gammaproteobacteria bacterium]|nr:glycosyltransferase [Gammaproteobacteria bacterium]
MKVLVVGDGHSAIHEVAVANALDELGHEVRSFYWFSYFVSPNRLGRFWQRIQNKFLLGPALIKLNSDLVLAAREFKPDLVFVYRGTHVYSHTISAIKNSVFDCVVCGYNNDDPFANGHSRLLWRHFLKSTPVYDLMFAYRHHNLIDFRNIGAKQVELLRSWYLPESNFPMDLTDDDKPHYECDVVFIGHFENDGRLQMLEEIARNGFNLRLYGPPYEWNHLLRKSEVLKHLAPVRLVWGEEYNKALCGAKISLCFFSKLNRDSYTRRCFEIPATGTLMLSEYSDDVASLYTEGEETDYFRNKEELLLKISRYIGNESLRCRVAAGGRKRVIEDGHDIVSRMKTVLDHVSTLKSKAEN